MKVQPRIDEIRGTTAKLKEEQANLLIQLEIAEQLLPLGVDFDSIGEGSRFWVSVGSMRSDRLPRFRWNLEEALEGEYMLVEVPSERTMHIILVGALIKHKDLLNRLLTSYGFAELKIPADLSGKPDDLVFDCQKKLKELEIQLEKLEEDRDRLAADFGQDILIAEENMVIEGERFRANTLLRETNGMLELWAWLPKQREEEVTQLIRGVDKTAEVSFQEPDFPTKDYPTALENNSYSRPYENLVNGFGTPLYSEWDPSFFVSLIFPILFGLMFSDVFHGLIVLLLGLYGMRLPKNPQPVGIGEELKSYIQQGGSILFWCGMSSIVFGFLFGSFFGIPAYSHVLPEWVMNLNVLRWFWAFIWHGILKLPILHNHGHDIYITAGWFSPEADVGSSAGLMGVLGSYVVTGYSGPMALLELAILIGSLQLSLGLVLFIIQLWRHRERKEALFFPTMFLIFYLCLIGLVFSLGPDPMAWVTTSIQEISIMTSGAPIQFAYFDFRAIPILSFIRVPVLASVLLGCLLLSFLIVSIYLLLHGMEGFAELIDFALTLISNTVSYLRLFAVNTAHAVLSFLFIFLLTSDAIFGSIVLIPIVGVSGLIIGILAGTALVCSLELLVSFLQTLRLHWVEFFSKMGYKGEGTAFNPFLANRLVTTPTDFPESVPT